MQVAYRQHAVPANPRGEQTIPDRVLAPASPSGSAAVYEQLREWLLSGVLAGGSVIQERRLADRLEVSRTPVREALQRLEGEGLLVRQDRFLRVVEITVSEV